MPKSKTKAKSSSRSRESDSDGDVQMTQPVTMTQAEKTISSLNADEVDRKVNNLVQFLLIMDQKKLPIKRQDVTKHILKEHSRAFPHFMAKAAEKLQNIFGVELVDMSGDKNKTFTKCSLINLLETDVDEPHLEWSAEDNAKLGLVMVILSTIFMSGNTLEEAKLFAMLKKLGVDVDSPHEIFGDPKKFISQELVKQGYVQHQRQGLSDPPAYDYSWGPRAKHETNKRNVLDFVCQVYGDTDPSKWTSQWQDLLRTEELAAPNVEK